LRCQNQQNVDIHPAADGGFALHGAGEQLMFSLPYSRPDPSRNVRSRRLRLGCRSFRSALALIWRIRSRVTAKFWPTSSECARSWVFTDTLSTVLLFPLYRTSQRRPLSSFIYVAIIHVAMFSLLPAGNEWSAIRIHVRSWKALDLKAGAANLIHYCQLGKLDRD
jgi:hypothetical protein